jgi:hypothetical protein
MDAVLDEIQMLHERITQLEFGYQDLVNAAKKAASGAASAAGKAYSAAGKAASAAVKKGSDIMHGSKTAPATPDSADTSTSYVPQRKNDKIQEIITDIQNITNVNVDVACPTGKYIWILQFSKDDMTDTARLMEVLHKKYNNITISSNKNSIEVTVPFNSQLNGMQSNLTAYSRAVLRQMDSHGA